MSRPHHHLRVPAPVAAPLTGHPPFADAPGVADPIEVTSRCLTRGGRPWFPVSGEFHYSRYPADRWEEELLKMKAGGPAGVPDGGLRRRGDRRPGPDHQRGLTVTRVPPPPAGGRPRAAP
ncbi:hypothetical protein ACFW7O_44780, partial [Streptomyces diastatochromogenes]